ncbi:MAG: NAD-dependent epimerase/dehydratase family protein [Cyanobacteria bacterium P01_F01_bin.53]
MILVTGASGQIGSDLVVALQREHGSQQVLASGRHLPRKAVLTPYIVLNVMNRKQLKLVVKAYGVDTIYHLAGVLSATGEQQPMLCWQVNIEGLKNVLEIAAENPIKVFWPSSIAVFGHHTPKLRTPQTTIEDPATMYGITKSTGEMLCQYYSQRFGVDVRSLRFPGIISHLSAPGGGTTDYAVEIFHAALKSGHYTSFLAPNTRLPMMYMPDAIRAIEELMGADADRLTVRSSYNLSAVSFSVAELVAEIQKYLPHFTCDYAPDYRQAIADSWPTVIDDTQARKDWGWQHHYDLSAIVKDMLCHLQSRQSEEVTPSCLQALPTNRRLTTFNNLDCTSLNAS